MKEERTLVAFEKHSIRRHYDEASETWFFSVVDVVAALTDSANAAFYWRVLKKRLKDAGGERNRYKMQRFENALR